MNKTFCDICGAEIRRSPMTNCGYVSMRSGWLDEAGEMHTTKVPFCGDACDACICDILVHINHMKKEKETKNGK